MSPAARAPFDAEKGALGAAAAFPRYAAPPPNPRAAAALQHALRLLAGLRCQGERPVRVLFYGQSITEQAWWRVVADELRARYPDTPLLVENRAIGGHPVQRLVKTAEADLYPFQPDLVIFHAYGSHRDYEALMRRIRERTTADVLIATDHVVADAELDEDTDPSALTAWWWTRWARALWRARPALTYAAWRNHVFLPGLARRLDLALIDVRGAWKSYLRQHQLPARALLKDDIHLNAHGEHLMGEILRPALAPLLLSERDCEPARGRELRVGRDVAVRNGRLALAFEGHRVELLLDRWPVQPIDVRINGRKPSQLASGHGFTRASLYPRSPWPALLRVRAGATPPVPETWTATLHAADDLSSVGFDLSGSVTGPDGSGVTSTSFKSRSGRIVIEPEDWNLLHAQQTFPQRPSAGFQVRWDAVRRGIDQLPGDAVGTLQGAAPFAVEVVQGLDNGGHTLELSGAGLHAVQAVRIHRPPAH